MPRSDPRKPLTVSELTARIKGRLEEFFPAVWVTGEITNFVRATSGHVYFTIKDKEAVLRCVMFRGFALRLHFEPRDGLDVIVRGGLSVYQQRGDYQLYVEELQPKGFGSAELALQQLKEKLLQKGYFDPRRKRALPRFPKRIALIASPTGAAVRDMLELICNRWPLCDVIVRPTRVQGEEAPRDIALAVRELARVHKLAGLTTDAIVIGRGGGSSEDLAAFNTEVVADAVFQSPIPVISAVGHEIDVCITDLVADYRALTPSQAITALCPDRAELLDDLIVRFDRMRDAMAQRLFIGRRTLDQLATRPVFRKPITRIRDNEQLVDDRAQRLHRVIQISLERHHQRMLGIADRLSGLNPLSVLKRGFSLTSHHDSVQVIRSQNEVQRGELIRTQLADGEIISRVEQIGNTNN